MQSYVHVRDVFRKTSTKSIGDVIKALLQPHRNADTQPTVVFVHKVSFSAAVA